LNALEIRTSIPNALNDPFELSPNIDPAQFTQKRCENFLRQDYNVDMWYEREGRGRGFTNKKAFKRWYLKDLPRRAAALLPKVPDNVERVRRNFLNSFSGKWRMICASLANDSILMWSHYADNHTGVVLALDMTQQPFSGINKKCVLTVNYSAKKPDYYHFHKTPAFERELFAVASTKATAWSYEREVRIMVPASPKVLRDMQFLPITPGAVSGVFLGCRASGVTKLAFRSALKAPHFDHVRLLQAELNRAEYSLDFEESRA
jgi:hypothetical protein